MKLPYGMMNFRDIIEEGYLYIDKTPFIELLENIGDKYPFFIRPRRFGKSLFLSTLKYYYDEIYAGDFESLFGKLYIGRKPTPRKNSFLVLSLDFSGLNTRDKDSFEDSFRESVILQIARFFSVHESFFPAVSMDDFISELKGVKDIRAIVERLLLQTERAGKKLFLLIDEYDHFASDILAMGPTSFYKDLIQASGFVRDFYEALKNGAKTVIDRIFITGLSPVMLDDLTSGYNISSNLTVDVRFNEMLGFTEEEVSVLLKAAGAEGQVSPDQLREYYNGYCFSEEAVHRIYNPDMILFYIKGWCVGRRSPRELIDDNVKTDYGRLKRLMISPRNRAALKKIIETGQVHFTPVSRFSFDQMYDPRYFESLLFYMGFLTFIKQKEGVSTYGVPNYVIWTLFWEYFRQELEQEYEVYLDASEIQLAVRDLAFKGELSPFITYVKEQVLALLSNRDLIRFDEKYIKVMLLSLLILSPLYRPESESETSGGYTDIFLSRDIRFPEVPWEWIWELKYLKESDRRLLEQTKEEGLKQLAAYKAGGSFKGRKDIKTALLIFVGRKDCYVYE